MSARPHVLIPIAVPACIMRREPRSGGSYQNASFSIHDPGGIMGAMKPLDNDMELNASGSSIGR